MSMERTRDLWVWHRSGIPIPELDMVGWTHPQHAVAQRLEPHRHRMWEVCLITQGGVDWWVEGTDHHVPAGWCYVTRPGEKHGGAHSALQPCTLWWLQADPTSSDELADGFTRLPRIFPGDRQLARRWQELLEALADPALQRRELRVRAAWWRLADLLLVSAERAGQRLVSPRIQAAMAEASAAAEHGGTTVPAMARRVGLSPGRFHELFLEEVGDTPARWLRRERIAVAKRRLNAGESVTSVALALGFASSQHFAAAFRVQTGISPSGWRSGRHSLPT